MFFEINLKFRNSYPPPPVSKLRWQFRTYSKLCVFSDLELELNILKQGTSEFEVHS